MATAIQRSAVYSSYTRKRKAWSLSRPGGDSLAVRVDNRHWTAGPGSLEQTAVKTSAASCGYTLVFTQRGVSKEREVGVLALSEVFANVDVFFLKRRMVCWAMW